MKTTEEGQGQEKGHSSGAQNFKSSHYKTPFRTPLHQAHLYRRSAVEHNTLDCLQLLYQVTAAAMVCIRQATVDDLLQMQRCNLMCLPENYQLKVTHRVPSHSICSSGMGACMRPGAHYPALSSHSGSGCSITCITSFPGHNYCTWLRTMTARLWATSWPRCGCCTSPAHSLSCQKTQQQ